MKTGLGDRRSLVPTALSVLFLLSAWAAAWATGVVAETVLANPVEAFSVLGRSLLRIADADKDVFVHVEATMARAFTGWLISVAMGTVIGVGASEANVFGRTTQSTMEILRAIPPVLALPLFLVACEFRNSAYVWTVVFGAVPVMSLAVAHGRRQVPSEKYETLIILGVSRLTRQLMLAMEVVPSILLGARLALSISLVVTIVSEMVFAPQNGVALGSLAKEAEIGFRTDVFFAVIILVAAIGYIANTALIILQQAIFQTADTSAKDAGI